MEYYKQLVRKVLNEGERKGDRTGTGTISLFSPPEFRFRMYSDLVAVAGSDKPKMVIDGFPLLTTKDVNMQAIIVELMWFLSGDTNIRYLLENKVNIWNDWPYKAFCRDIGPAFTMQQFKERILESRDFAAAYGDCGPIYGKQWRRWHNEVSIPDPENRFAGTIVEEPIDQIANVLHTLRTNPDSRRMIVSGWNTADIEEMAVAGLPPCHTLFQFYVSESRNKNHLEYGAKNLSLKLYIRSWDLGLGAPYNIASYALLLALVAKEVGMVPHDLIITIGDAHVYLNHLDALNVQLSRDTLNLPTLTLHDTQIEDVTKVKDNAHNGSIVLEGYNPHPAIRMPIAV